MNELQKAIQILGLQGIISLKDMDDRRRILTMVWHPDRFPTESSIQNRANEELKAINQAYDFLKDAISKGQWNGNTENDVACEASGGFTCYCGTSSTLDYQMISNGSSFSESAGVLINHKKIKTNIGPNISLMLLTYIDQESVMAPKIFGSCTSCTPCIVCGNLIQAHSFFERQEQLTSSRNEREYWYGTEFSYLHENCYNAYLKLVHEKRERESARRREAEERAKAEREIARRRANGLCLKCGRKLGFLDTLSGRDSHLTCKP